eukprot:COSAG02_NODE_5257_length_4492_cov_6.276121_2_plen_363_part_00
MESVYRPVDKAEGFAWCFTCEGQDENDARYNSALDNVMLALKDCNTPSSLEERLRLLSTSTVPPSLSNRSETHAAASTRIQSLDADTHAAVVSARTETSGWRELNNESQAAGGAEVLSAIQEIWRTRREWGPPSASGLSCRDDDGDEAALWCSLVTQRANVLHQERAAAGQTREQRFSEVQVFDCLTQLAQPTAGNSSISAHQQQVGAGADGLADTGNRGDSAGAAAADTAYRPISSSRLQVAGFGSESRDISRPASPNTTSPSAATDETRPVVLESSPTGAWTLAFPVLGIGYFGWATGDAVCVLLTSVAAFLRNCRAPKLRLVMVVPQAGDEVMAAVKLEQQRSESVASLDGRFEVRIHR